MILMEEYDISEISTIPNQILKEYDIFKTIKSIRKKYEKREKF
jgi:hypothetical protein